MIDISTLSDEERAIIKARREYQRRWREANKDKVKEHNKRFYEKMAKENASCWPLARNTARSARSQKNVDPLRLYHIMSGSSRR